MCCCAILTNDNCLPSNIEPDYPNIQPFFKVLSIYNQNGILRITISTCSHMNRMTRAHLGGALVMWITTCWSHLILALLCVVTWHTSYLGGCRTLSVWAMRVVAYLWRRSKLTISAMVFSNISCLSTATGMELSLPFLCEALLWKYFVVTHQRGARSGVGTTDCQAKTNLRVSPMWI